MINRNRVLSLNADNRINIFGIIAGLRINVSEWTYDGKVLFGIFICNARNTKEYETCKVLFEFKISVPTYHTNKKPFFVFTLGNKTWSNWVVR
jgi:hypothetical protein